MDVRTGGMDRRTQYLFQLQRLIQRIGPNIHHWNRSVFFSIDQLKRDTGWEPEYTFATAVEQTWDWMLEKGLHEGRQFDFEFEDDLIGRLGA